MKNIFKKSNQKPLFHLFLIFLPIIRFNLKFGCPIQFFTGISCLGCGMSRAALALLKLDFELAFTMHPLIFLMPFVAIAIIFRNKLSPKIKNILFVVTIALFIVVYIFRIITESDVVLINPEDGYIYRLITAIFNILQIK